MNPGAHHLPPNTLKSLLLLPSCLFQITSFTFNVFIHFKSPFLSDPSSILPLHCNAMGHSSLRLTFPFLSCSVTVFSFNSYLFYLVAHYIAKTFCIEKKYRIIIFFIPSCNKISVHRCRNTEKTFPIGRFTAPGDCTCVNEQGCVYECLYQSGGNVCACMLVESVSARIVEPCKKRKVNTPQTDACCSLRQL